MMRYPLSIRFKLIALAHQLSVTDAGGELVCYVRQKMFKLKEAVTVFGDAEQKRPLYNIKADRIIDWSARYQISDTLGQALGAIRRRGARSIWRASYEVESGGVEVFSVREENPWAKVFDNLMGEVPVLGMFTGYVFHPAYRVTRTASGAPVLRMVKRPALFEGRFAVEQLGEMSAEEERLLVLSLTMMILLERARG